MARRYSTYFCTRAYRLYVLKAEYQTTKKCKLHAPCTRGCSIFNQSRPYWNPQYNERQAYRHCTLRLTLIVTVNPKITIICGFSCPLTLQLLLQILPQVARFILLDLNWMLSVERNVVVDHSAVKDTYKGTYVSFG